VNRTFELTGSPAVRISIEGGSVELTTVDGLVARVEVSRDGGDEPGDDVFVGLRDVEGGAEIFVEQTRGSFWSHFAGGRDLRVRIEVPHGTRPHVRTASADVSARGAYGGARVNTASGDASIERVDGDLEIRSASGDVSADEVTGNLKAGSASGAVSIGRCDGDVSVRTASGAVRIRDAAGRRLEAQTASGDVEVDGVSRGSVNMRSASGDLTIGVQPGALLWLDTRSLSGRTVSELDVSDQPEASSGDLIEIRATTVSGDIRIRRSAAVPA